MYLAESFSKLKQFEGSIPWMYLDSVGLVTVAVGLMLPNSTSASYLAFQNPATGQPSSQQEIFNDYDRVKSMSANHSADYYHLSISPMLAESEIDRLLSAKVNSFEVSLRRIYQDYDTYPDPIKIALIDMIYNLGPNKLQSQYIKFNAAIKSHDWKMAAMQSHRNGPSAERNDYIKNLLMEA
jgi:GH24 family phage-related lysozyme (muramidase)